MNDIYRNDSSNKNKKRVRISRPSVGSLEF